MRVVKPPSDFAVSLALEHVLTQVVKDEAEEADVRARAGEVKSKLLSDRAKEMNDYWKDRIARRRHRR
jgi:hypothetical protein